MAAPGLREGLVAILTKSNALDGPNLTNSRRRLVLSFGPGGALAFLFYHPSRRHCTIPHYLASHILLPHFTAALLSFI